MRYMLFITICWGTVSKNLQKILILILTLNKLFSQHLPSCCCTSSPNHTRGVAMLSPVSQRIWGWWVGEDFIPVWDLRSSAWVFISEQEQEQRVGKCWASSCWKQGTAELWMRSLPGAARSLQRRLRSLWLRTSRCFWRSFLLLEERIRQQLFLYIFPPLSTYSF